MASVAGLSERPLYAKLAERIIETVAIPATKIMFRPTVKNETESAVCPGSKMRIVPIHSHALDDRVETNVDKCGIFRVPSIRWLTGSETGLKRDAMRRRAGKTGQIQ